MKTELRWKRGFFQTAIQIYSNEMPVGTLKGKSWSQTTEGLLNGESFAFVNKGFFKSVTLITDTRNKNEVGKITYSSWKNKAEIEHSGKTFSLKYTNTWGTKWSLSDAAGNSINYQGSSSKGTIESDILNNMLIMTGLFIANYYWQRTTVIVALLIPVFIATTH
jgi:hypothetical protein